MELVSEPTPGFDTLQDVVVRVKVEGRWVEVIRTLRTGEGMIAHSVTFMGLELMSKS